MMTIARSGSKDNLNKFVEAMSISVMAVFQADFSGQIGQSSLERPDLTWIVGLYIGLPGIIGIAVDSRQDKDGTTGAICGVLTGWRRMGFCGGS